jgi:hypothetical protein
MRPLDTTVLVLWSLATLGLVLAVVQRTVRVRRPRMGRFFAWGAVVGAASALALVARATHEGVFAELTRSTPHSRSGDAVRGALTTFIVALPVAAALCAGWAVVRGGRPEAPARERLVLEAFALALPVACVVGAWVEGTGTEWRWMLVAAAPFTAVASLLLGTLHATMLDRRDVGGVVARYGWCLGLHGFAFYATAVDLGA